MLLNFKLTILCTEMHLENLKPNHNALFAKACTQSLRTAHGMYECCLMKHCQVSDFVDICVTQRQISQQGQICIINLYSH